MAFIKNIASTVPDHELISTYKSSGDQIILAELYQRYMDLVYGVCLKYLTDTEEAKDSVLLIYQELVTKLMKHEVLHFKPWLYQLSINHCLMILRSRKKMPFSSLDRDVMQIEESLHLNGIMEKEENFKHLYHCLSKLIPDQKKVLELFYLENKCYNQIVSQTGIEWNNVRSYLQNGRRNLKICIEKQINNNVSR